MSQFITYILVVLFSGMLGFKLLIFLDCLCQLLSAFMSILIKWRVFRKLYVLQLSSFIFGITTATGQTFQNYIYSVFDKDLYHALTGYLRIGSLAGHGFGSLIGYFFSLTLDIPKLYIDSCVSHILNGEQFDHDTVLNELEVRSLNIYFWIMFSTLVFMGCATIVYFFFPPVANKAASNEKSTAVNTKSNTVKSGTGLVAEIIAATSQLKKRSTMFWAISWMLTSIVLNYFKQWSSSLWGHHQRRLNQEPINGLIDCFGYFSGAIGSAVPAIILQKSSFQVAIVAQLFVSAFGVLLSVLLTIDIDSMNFYYYLQVLLNFVIYYSNSFQSGELAKGVEKSQVKLLFYLLNFFSFALQIGCNVFMDGVGHLPPFDISERFISLAVILTFTCITVAVGFLGSSNSKKESDSEVVPGITIKLPTSDNNNDKTK